MKEYKKNSHMNLQTEMPDLAVDLVYYLFDDYVG